MNLLRLATLPVFVVLTFSCGAEQLGDDAGRLVADGGAVQVDSSIPSDGGRVDGGTLDAGTLDGGRDDAGLHDAGTEPVVDGGTQISCAAVSCDSPPATACTDAQTLTTYSAQGSCANGICTYAATSVSCTTGCANAACLPGACSAVSCDAPPSSTCDDAVTLKSYASGGTCDAGVCTYVSSTAACPFGCSNGACLADPCLTLTCNAPPPAECANSTTLKIYANNGVCSNAQCTYQSSTSTCSFGCIQGACLPDPCLSITCNTPPAAICHDATSLTTSASTGTCVAGVCSYSTSVSNCQFGCASGACLPDPCLAVTCNAPPSPVCADATFLTTYAAPGSCNNGMCTYGSSSSSCTFGCMNGACKADPCASVVCNQPPTPACFNTTTLRSPTGAATCSAGTCTYQTIDSPCGASERCMTSACKWDDSTLSGLSFDQGTIVFSPSRTAYAFASRPGATSISVTATVSQPTRATIRVNGTVVVSGVATSIALIAGAAALSVSVTAESGAGTTYSVAVTAPSFSAQQAYVKASNTGAQDWFGSTVAVSGDGMTIAVGATNEDSIASGVNGDQSDNTAFESGAVYVFTRVSGVWSLQAYLKPSNTRSNHSIHFSTVALSYSGDTLAVGASAEDSGGTGINGDQFASVGIGSGAVYVFTRSGNTWSQQAFVKPAVLSPAAAFGTAVSLSNDGNVLAVSAQYETSNGTGIDAPLNLYSAGSSGAAFVFVRSGTTWSQQAYFKASNTEASDFFGSSIALSGDATTLAVGAFGEDSAATGVGGSQSDNSASLSGAVYVFSRTGSTWAQQAYVKASNTGAGDLFGLSVALDTAGNTLAVGAYAEASNARVIDGTQTNNSFANAGAAYVFSRSGSTWSQQAYIKASNADADDAFGYSVSLSGDGNMLAVGARGEGGNGTGLGGDPANNSLGGSGAAYLFTRTGVTWSQRNYIKASAPDAADNFGFALGLSTSGTTLLVGARFESSSSTGVNGPQNNNSSFRAGAAYVFVP